jgi:hypothetical protein
VKDWNDPFGVFTFLPFGLLTDPNTIRDKASPLHRIFSLRFRLKEKDMKQSTTSRLVILFLVIIFVALPRLVLALQVGDKAPDFELDSSKGGKLKLSSLKGKNVLINFYVLDFSPT